MIPRWQIAGAILLALASAVVALVTFPRSYAHAYLWGQCGKPGEPAECRYHSSGRGGYRGSYY